MEKFKVATVQMNALKDDLEHNLDVHVRFIEEAAQAGCALILFPELSVTAHYGETEVLKFAQEAESGSIYTIMRDLAKKHDIVVCYGFCEIARGTHYNSLAFMGPQGLIGVQRKTHASSDEYFVFRMGQKFETFNLGFCKAGSLICYDSAFSENWRVLGLRGVDVVLQPSAGRMGGMGRRPEVPLEEQLARLRQKVDGMPGGLRHRARENGLFAVHCNQAGYNGHSTHVGGAYVIDPMGRLLAKSKPVINDHFICAELDPDLLAEARRKPGFNINTRRPDLYHDLTRMI